MSMAKKSLSPASFGQVWLGALGDCRVDKAKPRCSSSQAQFAPDERQHCYEQPLRPSSPQTGHLRTRVPGPETRKAEGFPLTGSWVSAEWEVRVGGPERSLCWAMLRRGGRRQADGWPNCGITERSVWDR